MTAQRDSGAWRFAGFTLDLGRGALLTGGGAEVVLRPKSFALLRLFVENPGRLLDRDTILAAVWPSVVVGDEAITQCVREIRKAIGDEAQQVLRTVPKRGYVLTAEVVATGSGAGVAPADESARLRRAGDTAYGWHKPALVLAGALFALVFAGGVWALWPSDGLPPGKPAIAVLAFDNLGGDEATGRLADGLTEDIITDLARFRDLDVIARNSTAVYEGKPVDVRQVGKELGVRYVLEGSIQRTGDQIRMNAQLIDARSGAHIWANRWDRPISDLFAAQDELADQVASRLGGYYGSVAEADRAAAKRKRPENLSAYELYLLGIEHKHRMELPDLEQAKRLFDEALAKDPKLARALVGRAWTHDILTAFGPPYDFVAGMAAAEADALSALALDPQDAEAYAVLGDALYNQGRFEESAAAYERALTLNPSSADIASFAAYLAFLGQPERAAALADRALKLNPNYPPFYPYFLGPAYFLASRPNDAIRILASVPLEQRNLLITVPLAGSYAMLGQQQEAAEAVDEVRRADPSLSGEAAVATLWKFARDQERRLFVDALGKAGLPLCAPDSALADIDAKDRLPECEAERAKASSVANTG